MLCSGNIVLRYICNSVVLQILHIMQVCMDSVSWFFGTCECTILRGIALFWVVCGDYGDCL